MEKALVTGGLGFLGSWIVKRLRAREIEVRVLALPGERDENLEGERVERIDGDIRDPEACARAVDGCDAVFHAAALYEAWAPDPTRMYEINVRGTFHVLEAARRARAERIVVTASIASLGRPPEGAIADERSPFESWDIDFPYARSKYLGRELAEAFAAWGLDVRIVCPGIVIGPNDTRPTPSGALILTSQRMPGPPIAFAGGASYVDVRDAAEAHVLAALSGKPGERYVVAGAPLSNLEFVEAIERATGRLRKARVLPVPLARALVRGFEAKSRLTKRPPELSRAFFEFGLRPSYFSSAKAERELGVAFRPIDESIRDAIAFFRSRAML